jgi:excisionase family DNA binding protein
LEEGLDGRFGKSAVARVMVGGTGVWLTVDDAAEKLQLHRNSIYEACRLGKMRHVRIGRKIRIKEEWLEDLMHMSEAA